MSRNSQKKMAKIVIASSIWVAAYCSFGMGWPGVDSSPVPTLPNPSVTVTPTPKEPEPYLLYNFIVKLRKKLMEKKNEPI
jgi:hypothetical protein